MGADDYVIKPFHLRELSARVKTVMRRSAAIVHDIVGQEKEKPATAAIYHFDRWKMDCNKYEISDNSGYSVSLTDGEFKLLYAFIHSPNRVLRREHIFDMTRDNDYNAYDRAVDIQIGRLRKKLKDNPRQPALIKTVRGVGYIFIGKVVKQ
jgi:two-component system phosphate regulon response regulator OmpR